MMASDETTPRVLANDLLQANGKRAVLHLDAIAGKVIDAPSTFTNLLDSIYPHLRDMPTAGSLYNPERLEILSACFINLSETFRLKRNPIQRLSRNLRAILEFWASYRRWIERFQMFVFNESMDELEGHVTPSGIHDVWDLAGWVSLVLYELALIPEITEQMKQAQFQAIQIRLWVRVRVCSRPRILLEDRIGDVMDLILDRTGHNNIIAKTLKEFSESFILECYDRVIGRVRHKDFATKEHDHWTTCFRFVQIVYMNCEPLWLLFLANGCLYFQLYAFRRHMSPHSDITGRAAYLKFFPSVIYASVPALADSPLWIPQAIDSHLLPIIVGSAAFIAEIERGDDLVAQNMVDLFRLLRTNLIHRSVLKCVLRSIHRLRKKYGNLEELFEGEVNEAWRAFLRNVEEMREFSMFLKSSGLDFSDCSYPLCRGGDTPPKQCNACRRVFYCSPECQRAHWKDHRDECRKSLAEKEKGTVLLHADPRHKAFVMMHASYMVAVEDRFSALLANFKEANPRANPRHLVAVFDYTQAPPRLAVVHAASYMGSENWATNVDKAEEGSGQLAFIQIPYIANEYQTFFVLLEHAVEGSMLLVGRPRPVGFDSDSTLVDRMEDASSSGMVIPAPR